MPNEQFIGEKYKGLTSEEASAILAKSGLNVLPEKKKSFLKKLLTWLISPVSLMLLAAAFLSLYIGKDADFWIILFLFASNFIISIWHERKADQSIAKLQKRLTLRVKVFRDNAWSYLESTNLAPGDLIELKVGAVVPADATILEAENLSINESVLTGESLPKQKQINEIAYSGSFVTTGGALARVKATGGGTFFGKTILSIDIKPRRSSLEKDIISISRFISLVAIFVAVLLTVILYDARTNFAEVLTLDLSLLIAGIPVALPTVMSLIISIGVFELSKKQVIVRRLASLEDLANVNLLLSDKTGTLTQNRIVVKQIESFNDYSETEVIKLALSAIADQDTNPIDKAVYEKGKEMSLEGYEQVDYIPGDSERKRSTGFINLNNKEVAVSLGAPHIIISLCAVSKELQDKFEESVKSAGKDGYRTLALAINKSGKTEAKMEVAGLLLLADNLHPDAKSTIQFMNSRGIGVKMLTGDSFEISQKVVKELGLVGEVVKREVLDGDPEAWKKQFSSIASFTEVLPKDKYSLVSYARENYTVAVTGDGINDLPAIKNADVGFAVSNAVDALKNSADIVLLKNGISVIREAIIEARRIFNRLYNYSLYRISESFRVIITIAVIGLIYKIYPLTPVQLIILAFLNDVPIITLAFDRVKVSEQPAHIDAKKRFLLSSLFGLTGVANSLILLFIMTGWWHLSWDVIQTVFFLKLTVSGHMLIYVAHTKEKWFSFLPSRPVILATIGTQLVATAFAFWGIFITPISLPLIIIVWLWSFFWMQISELMKSVNRGFRV